MNSSISRAALAAVLSLSWATPARADSGLSLYVGPQFISQNTARSIASDVQTDIAAAYDLGPKTIIPVRASLQADDAFGSSANGHLNTLGLGAAVRLTTPIYAGIGASFYTTSISGGGSSISGSSIGTNLFVGNQLFGLPGISLSIEGSYKAIPTTNGVNPSAYGIGVRAHF